MTEYEKALKKWAKGLSDKTLAEYLDESGNWGWDEAEWDALFFEDIRRMQVVA